MRQDRLPKYTLKEVCNILKISQTTLYRIRKENGLLTKVVKRRYCEQEIEELGKIILDRYNQDP